MRHSDPRREANADTDRTPHIAIAVTVPSTKDAVPPVTAASPTLIQYSAPVVSDARDWAA
jgi:hypothetical protein